MKKYSKKYWVFRWLFLAGYLGAAGVLIVEAALPREASAKQSHAVGSVVGGLVNDMNGDQAKEVLPTKATIQNKKTDYKVGEEVFIEVDTEPEDATYKSYIYSSSNKDVASVDDNGLVSFLEEGTAVVTAKNVTVPEIYDTITFSVTTVPVESMTSTINATLEDDVYKLEIYEDYVINNVIKPNNATYKLVTYDYPENDYFTLEDDTIHVIGDSNEAVVEIKVSCGEITNTLKVKTFAPPPPVEDYPIEDIKVSSTTKYTDQTSEFSPTVTYVPSYTSAKYKGYTLESNNEEIVKVTSSNKLKITGTVGSAVITVTSKYNPDIHKEMTVTVKARPQMTSIKVGKYSSVMYVDATQTVSVTVTPSNAKVTKTYTSSNTSVISVNNSGKLTALAVGTSTIKVKVKDSYNNELSEDFSVEVKDAPPPNCASDFVIDYKVNENPIVYVEKEFNLDDYFGIASFIGNASPLDTTAFDYNFDDIGDDGTYDSHKFTPHKVGEMHGYITFTNEDSSVISKEIKFTVIDRFKLCKRDGTDLEDTTITLDAFSTVVLIIKDNGKTGQSYKATVNNNTIVVSDRKDTEKSITITAKEVGTGVLTITPVVKLDDDSSKVLNEYAKQVTFKVNDVTTTRLDVYFYKDEKTVTMGEEPTVLYMNETLEVRYSLDENTTNSRVTMKLNNTNATIRNGILKPSKIGETKLTVTENVTGLSKEYNFVIKHRVGLKDTGPFLLSGSADYDEATNTIVIINGDHAKIAVNFTAESTYKKVTYEVADTNICRVGTDGSITPIKVGTTKVRVTVKDSANTYVDFEVNIRVDRKPFITDMNDFFLKVRKATGHFGAFAVFGFLGAMTWFLFFRKKLFPAGVAANYAIGFGLSYLTELIQRYTPGRAFVWSDIWLDFTGFSIAAGVTTIVIIGIWATRLIIRKIKAKKAITKEEPKEEAPATETPKEEVKVEEPANNETKETGEK